VKIRLRRTKATPNSSLTAAAFAANLDQAPPSERS
jgi:hypothetical protein